MKTTDKKAYLKQIREVIDKGPYRDDWASLTDFVMPSWFEKAKFGIFIHWGLYSVPAFNNEWYSRNMYIQGSPEFEHHVKTYGLHKDFGYKDFIPLFTADRFDPDFWAETFAAAGAKYVVPVAEHHDGFQMYESGLSVYNAAQMGPKRDILGELKNAFEKKGLIFCTSSHRAEHFWFMGNGKDFDSDIKEPLSCGDFYWPSIPQQPDFQDLFAKPYPTQEFLEDWICRTCEIIDRYQPEILYFDWWIQHEGYKDGLRRIAAYYYNRGVERGHRTAICYKHDAMAFGSGIVDIERGKFADTRPYYWQTDTSVARNSWCYTTSLDYKSSKEKRQPFVEYRSESRRFHSAGDPVHFAGYRLLAFRERRSNLQCQTVALSIGRAYAGNRRTVQRRFRGFLYKRRFPLYRRKRMHLCHLHAISIRWLRDDPFALQEPRRQQTEFPRHYPRRGSSRIRRKN